MQTMTEQIQKLEQGSIIETITNPNGTAIKYADGTLICYQMLGKEGFLNTSSLYETAQNIKIYRSQLSDWVYPVAFIAVPNIQIQPLNNANGTRFLIARPHIRSATHVQIQLLGIEDFTANAIGYTNLEGVFVQAIGRWKD